MCAAKGDCLSILRREKISDSTVFTISSLDTPAVSTNDSIEISLSLSETEECQVYGHTTTLIENKCSILIGGFGSRNSRHQRVKDIFLFNSTTNSLTQCNLTGNSLTSLQRQFHTATLLRDGRILVIGGRTSPLKAYTSLLLITVKGFYGPKADAEVEEVNLTDCPPARWRHAAVRCDNKNGWFYFHSIHKHHDLSW